MIMARRTPRKIVARAFAKINLSLRVRSRRPDGFHELCTIFQAIDLADTLTCTERTGPFRIVCRTPGVPRGRTNLVWRAAEALWREAAHDTPPRDTLVEIVKRIPLQSGLGGSSSNAAAALLALRRLWKLAVDDDRLNAIARDLGADVPFFLVGGSALGLGRGDEIYPLADPPRSWVVLAHPSVGVPTVDAYGWLDADQAAGLVSGEHPQRLDGVWGGHRTPLINDLEAPVIRRHPEVGALRDALRSQGAVMAAMSGSGSTVFGVFGDRRTALVAHGRLRRAGWGTTLARMLDRRGSARLIGS